MGTGCKNLGIANRVNQPTSPSEQLFAKKLNDRGTLCLEKGVKMELNELI